MLLHPFLLIKVVEEKEKPKKVLRRNLHKTKQCGVGGGGDAKETGDENE
jgi:hypothetical protein